MATNPGVLSSNQPKNPTTGGVKGGKLARLREWYMGLRKGEKCFPTS